MFIAFTQLTDTEQLLILGLSQQNRERLDAGQPIRLSRETHGLAIPAGLKIFLFAGGTEVEMREALGELIGPATVVGQKRPQ